MLSSLLVPIVVLLGVGALAFPAEEVDNCTTFPSWTISDFNSTTKDTVGAGGSASFKLVNNLTGASDELTCSLQVNYRCIFAGTPSDKNLTVNVAVRAESLTLLLDETVECPGRTSPLHVIGNGDLDLNCTWAQDIGGTVTCSLEDEENTIQGAAVEVAPGRRRR
ncbi:hypothetical protein BR93DRAFT_935167 [Coniochaeta sp. PMI_546]|nr:hypothetical protein BR93DRAFT_935167 [Coniochaeta sp. PMI_546]